MGWEPHHRYANRNWSVWVDSDGVPADAVQRAILLDIRAELQTLNSVFRCLRFQGIPTVLNAIRRNTTKPRKKKAK